MPRAHDEWNNRQKSGGDRSQERGTDGDGEPDCTLENFRSQPVAPFDANVRTRVGAMIGRAALNLRAR
jgi:hypothetical protein